MSHLVSIQTRLHDPVAIAAACKRLGLAGPVHGKARLYSGEAEGLLLQLPGWRYPCVIDTASGEVRYDNFQADGVRRNSWTAFSSGTPWRRPSSKPENAAARSASKAFRTAPSG